MSGRVVHCRQELTHCDTGKDEDAVRVAGEDVLLLGVQRGLTQQFHIHVPLRQAPQPATSMNLL
jgi:hypothetical protein